MKKKVVIYIPDSSSGVYLPLLWASCKSYYELKGKYPNKYEWIHPRINYEFDDEKLKQQLLEVKPDIFGISMYIWNDVQCLEIAKWIKETFPKCLVISGGPQQYFKHDNSWFQNYPFLDASLDGGEYGELTVADILDNLRDDNTVDWNLVREVVYPDKHRKNIFKSKKSTNKLDFFWDYSPYDMQRKVILECAEEIKVFDTHVNGKLETTRGCPYSCAFCDWGGGIGSKVIKKPLDKVKKDIDVIEESGCSYVFLCDANFGILAERDIEIMTYIANKKKRNPGLFHLYFGGFAKSDKHTEYIKKILDIDAQHNLTWDLSYKASVQSVHKDVLTNIKRSDISFDKHVYLAKYLKENYNFSSYAECISGLPGITVDKWYDEINIFTSHDMDICLYNWHLLPETPSYDFNYRRKMGMETVNKYNNMQASNSTLRKSEVVVATYSYTKEDYKEMWIAFSIQRAFWATGLLEDTLKIIFLTEKIGYGDFIKKFYRTFLRSDSCGTAFKNHLDRIDKRFQMYYDPESEVSNTSLDFPTASAPMNSSFMLMLYYNFEDCRDPLLEWLLSNFPYLKRKKVVNDLDKFITHKNKFTKKFNLLRYISYSNNILSQFRKDQESDLIDFIITQMETYTKTNFLRARMIGL